MELTKKSEPKVFEWFGIKFYVRSYVTAYDNFSLACNRNSMKNGALAYDPENYFATIIRLFVERWDGVTENEVAVPFSLERLRLLELQSPKDGFTGNPFIDLGTYISEQIIEAYLAKVEMVKKKSVNVSDGSLPSPTSTDATPSPATPVESTKADEPSGAKK